MGKARVKHMLRPVKRSDVWAVEKSGELTSDDDFSHGMALQKMENLCGAEDGDASTLWSVVTCRDCLKKKGKETTPAKAPELRKTRRTIHKMDEKGALDRVAYTSGGQYGIGDGEPYVEHVITYRLKCGQRQGLASESWHDVNCKACLRKRPKKKVSLVLPEEDDYAGHRDHDR